MRWWFMKISVIIITFNEILNISDCLQGLGFADEVIVVDNASTDGTAEMAKNLGARVFVTEDWPGFGCQKNRALDYASGEWVLSIDADERVTPSLRDEILKAISHPSGCTSYAIPRSSWFCGRFMQYSGWSPDYVNRLFRNGSARFSNDLVHERLLIDGRSQRLSQPLLHYSFRNFSDVLQKVDRYSTASAKQAFSQGKKASVFKALGHGLWAFVRTYILKAGFLDGSHGLALAISSAEGSYYRYLKLWLLQENAKHEPVSR